MQLFPSLGLQGPCVAMYRSHGKMAFYYSLKGTILAGIKRNEIPMFILPCICTKKDVYVFDLCVYYFSFLFFFSFSFLSDKTCTCKCDMYLRNCKLIDVISVICIVLDGCFQYTLPVFDLVNRLGIYAICYFQFLSYIGIPIFL